MVTLWWWWYSLISVLYAVTLKRWSVNDTLWWVPRGFGFQAIYLYTRQTSVQMCMHNRADNAVYGFRETMKMNPAFRVCSGKTGGMKKIIERRPALFELIKDMGMLHQCRRVVEVSGEQ